MALLEETALAQEFPIFGREGLVYLDSAATSQKPRQVIEAVDAFYAEHNANVHRAVYPLAIEADELYDGARAKVAAFCGALPEETIFTSNATSAINLVSHAWGPANVGEGDEIVLSVAEHHANIVPRTLERWVTATSFTRPEARKPSSCSRERRPPESTSSQRS
ncbi:MAG: aminotransferase class V-fold PLP-dependent enzyme [Solirubrobacterales bacterium]